MMRLTTDDILSLSPYVPGKPIEELERELGITNIVKLASNENPLGPSPKAVAAISGILGGLHRYPDGAGYYLKDALSKKSGWPVEGIVLGNGSNEILESLVKTFLLEGENAVMAEPSFIVYKMAAQAAGRERKVVPLKDGRHDLAAMADAVTLATKIVFIANPNNPTGTMNTADEFDVFMKRVPEDVIVVVDEAYYEYATDPAYPDTLKYLRDGRMICVLRTFSKAYGLAGLRIGYGYVPAEIAGILERTRQPFNTNTLAQAAALAALSDTAHVTESVRVNDEGKKYLYAVLDGMGISYYPTQANFIYMDIKSDAKAAFDALLGQGVIVRPMGPTQIRVTVGTMAENERFVDALKAVNFKSMSETR